MQQKTHGLLYRRTPMYRCVPTHLDEHAKYKNTMDELVYTLQRDTERIQQEASHKLDAAKTALETSHKETTRDLQRKLDKLQTEHLQRKTSLKQDVDRVKQDLLLDKRSAVDQRIAQ